MKKRIKQLPRMIYIEIDYFFFLLLSWTLKSTKHFSKAEEEHGGTFDLSSFGSLSLPCCTVCPKHSLPWLLAHVSDSAQTE